MTTLALAQRAREECEWEVHAELVERLTEQRDRAVTISESMRLAGAEMVEAIRLDYSGGLTYTEIGHMYGISRSLAWKIVAGKGRAYAY